MRMTDNDDCDTHDIWYVSSILTEWTLYFIVLIAPDFTHA